MPSIPKTKTAWIQGLVLFGLLAALIGWTATHFPEPPQAPRYVGAGNDVRRNGGILRFAEGSDVRTLDPHIAYDTLSNLANRLMFDGLLDYDYEANFIPMIAKELPTISKDGKTFRFELREGVLFHNGREVTAEDVSWSMHRLLSKKLGSPAFSLYKTIVGAEAYHDGKADRIEGVRVLDRYAIEFELTIPNRTFLNVMAMPFAYPLPKEAVEAAEAAEGPGGFGKNPVGAGPYRFVRWERGVQIEVARFDDYWNFQPRPDRAVFMYNVSNHIGSARLRNGDVDIHYRPSKVDNLFFMQSEAWKPYRAEFASPSIFALTMNCGMEPFDNVHVRRAVSFAIDRKKIRKSNPTRYMPADQLIPPNLPGHFDDLEHRQEHNLTMAKEEMRLAGYPDGWPEPIEVWVRTEGESQITQMIQADLAKIGIDVKIKFVSFATYIKEAGRRGAAQASFSGWHADYPDPSNFTDTLFSTAAIHPENSENRSFYSNPKLDGLLDEALGEPDTERRMAMYREASNILAYDAPWAYLFYPVDSFVWQPYVKGFRVHPVWSQEYRSIWLDLPRQRVSAGGSP